MGCQERYFGIRLGIEGGSLTIKGVFREDK